MIFNSRGESIQTILNYRGNLMQNVFNSRGELVSCDNGTELVVMSYNIQRSTGMNANTNIINTIFDKYSPDIIGFQEYDNSKNLDNMSIADFLKERWDYLYVGDTKITNYTKAIASNFELTETKTIYYTVWTESRSYQKAYIVVDDKKIAVFNTHLDYDYQGSADTPKVKQARELFDAVANEKYFIIIGDLNTCCTSIEQADYINMIKQFVDAGYNIANCSEQFGFFNTWTNGTTATNGQWEQTDNIITSSNIAIKQVILDDTKLNVNTGEVIDHLPLVAILSVSK